MIPKPSQAQLFAPGHDEILMVIAQSTIECMCGWVAYVVVPFSSTYDGLQSDKKN